MNLDALREKRKTLHENMAWRKAYIESTRAAQIRTERDSIISIVDHIPPGMRQVYLKARLAKLKASLQ